MRVVSLVPSWTETFIDAGINVVGRTRFCIHPQDKVSSIAVIGGTKNWDFEKILELKPDILVLDQEENPKFMAEQNIIPFVSTHVTSLHDVSEALKKLSVSLKSKNLEALSDEWKSILSKNPLTKWDMHKNLPGVIEWGIQPSARIKSIYYVIWKNPWMVVSKNTFIGSVLGQCGLGDYLSKFPSKYPEMSLENLPDKESTLLLFSSEPFPFLQKKEEVKKLGFPHAFVDGEKFSWFGVRSLKFLKGL